MSVNMMCQAGEHTLGTGMHKHECGRCGCVWKHPDDMVDGTKHDHASFEEAHSCPKCGQGGVYTKLFTEQEESQLRDERVKLIRDIFNLMKG